MLQAAQPPKPGSAPEKPAVPLAEEGAQKEGPDQAKQHHDRYHEPIQKDNLDHARQWWGGHREEAADVYVHNST